MTHDSFNLIVMIMEAHWIAATCSIFNICVKYVCITWIFVKENTKNNNRQLHQKEHRKTSCIHARTNARTQLSHIYLMFCWPETYNVVTSSRQQRQQLVHNFFSLFYCDRSVLALVRDIHRQKYDRNENMMRLISRTLLLAICLVALRHIPLVSFVLVPFRANRFNCY